MSTIHRIAYSPLPDITSKVALAPLVPATLTYGTQEYPGFALVDSGAMGCVISTVIAEELGIAWHKTSSGQGFSVGGIFRFHRVEGVKIEIYGHVFQLSLSVVEGVSPYKFILGQNDLFHQAKITFEEYKRQFTIEFRKFN